MGERLAPVTRIIISAAFFVGLGIMLLDPFSWGRLSGLGAVIGISLGVIVAAALMAMLLGRGEMPEEEFRRIAERSELMARMPAGQMQPSEFEELVIQAIDEFGGKDKGSSIIRFNGRRRRFNFSLPYSGFAY